MIRRRLNKTTVIVHLRSNQSVQGVLDGVYRDCIVLRQATHLDEKVKLQGDLVVPRDSVDFYQTVEVPNG